MPEQYDTENVILFWELLFYNLQLIKRKFNERTRKTRHYISQVTLHWATERLKRISLLVIKKVTFINTNLITLTQGISGQGIKMGGASPCMVQVL